ncbi:MAG TPA: YhfC family glutamic-type intramembrane protease [Anaerolineaceae bacterium]|nr:YhfC family glutamic-type intramembrane protease [Anaerolineaceae bacterium]
METQTDPILEVKQTRIQWWQLLFWFALGALCFFVAQILLRIPLLTLMQSSTSIIAFLTANQNWVLPISIVILLSAGLFEEGFRFLFKQFLLKPAKSPYLQPLFFGIGHALCEATFLLLPLIPVYPLSVLWPAILERLMTLFIHIGLTFIVWNGFQNGKKWLHLVIAILAHGLVNAVIPISSQLQKSEIVLPWLIVSMLSLIAYSLYSRKYYRLENPS